MVQYHAIFIFCLVECAIYICQYPISIDILLSPLFYTFPFLIINIGCCQEVGYNKKLTLVACSGLARPNRFEPKYQLLETK